MLRQLRNRSDSDWETGSETHREHERQEWELWRLLLGEDPESEPLELQLRRAAFNLRQLTEVVNTEADELTDLAHAYTSEEAVPIYKTGAKSDTSAPCAVQQFVHYFFRGEELQHLCFYEWAALIVVEPKTQNNSSQRQTSNESMSDGSDSDASREDVPLDGEAMEDLDANMSSSSSSDESASDAAQPAASTSRRISPNLGTTIAFHPNHPMAATHQQRLRRVYQVPILCGRPPPNYPGPMPTAAHSQATNSAGTERAASLSNWRTSAQRYAEYMLCLFSPWKAPTSEQRVNEVGQILGVETEFPINFEGFARMYAIYRGSDSQVLQHRAFCIESISSGLRTSYRAKTMVSKWRN